jgi:hypothetical protein
VLSVNCKCNCNCTDPIEDDDFGQRRAGERAQVGARLRGRRGPDFSPPPGALDASVRRKLLRGHGHVDREGARVHRTVSGADGQGARIHAGRDAEVSGEKEKRKKRETKKMYRPRDASCIKFERDPSR